MDIIKRVGRTKVCQGNLLTMYSDDIELPDGTIVHWDYLGHKGAAAVVPVLSDGRILMVRQFRNSIDRVTLEIPAGCKDSPDETGLACAMRELEEETGYACAKEDMEPLVHLVTAIAFCNETIEIFVARNLIPTHQHLDPEEFLDVEAWRLEDLMDKIYKGEVQDSKTVAAVMAYANRVRA